MRRVLSSVGVAAWILMSGVAFAQEPQGVTSTAEEFEAKLGYQTGDVTLKNGMATIHVPESFRFLGPEGSRRLLTEAWGNPPESADDVLGMLVPSAVSPLTNDGWGIVITYDEDGYVDDSDAAKINYANLLKQMQEDTVAVNEERKKEGFDEARLVGWAEQPHYDAAAHKLYWAKDLVFGSTGEHTLNYNIRILGRRGVLVLNAVASMAQLEAIRGETGTILPAVEFNEGHRYTDYLPGTDKAAAYGIGGLILGGVAAKAGLFKLLWVGLLAAKKVLVAAVLAIVAFIKKLFGGKSSETAEATAAN
jgi:uncharacterized membrane-anchored protein